MKRHYTLEDFGGRIDSLYRLVLIAARRASQISRPEGRSFIPTKSRKPTMIALDEILEGKVTYRTEESDEEEFVE
jgi:DNA-directed RNA polymerase omega subunit